MGTKEHQALVDDILFEFGSMSTIRLWKRVVGFDRTKKIKYGITGESDIEGIMLPNGRMIAIEVKTGSGKLSKEQIIWRDMFIKFGGLYVEARSVQDVYAALA